MTQTKIGTPEKKNYNWMEGLLFDKNLMPYYLQASLGTKEEGKGHPAFHLGCSLSSDDYINLGVSVSVSVPPLHADKSELHTQNRHRRGVPPGYKRLRQGVLVHLANH